ncbi:hypothetical protein A1F94_001597 [Pyrenophora tritici-repentis]|uniref:Uncharacterized protein n=1 Tax=Pyrenophora tritici-repentis TaxID=45151 RepID=A0A316ZZV7_9PLEO|nr:hypothetical protein A1F94_001597 [Pyrenophora tritici-repentis]KAI1518189.1 hypothetical protein Ptr86124_003490 [Pyrenophora tritici-repentis]KAI1527926.1 hypothetical protein PtrSN001A_009218 [Pyrenophora tritici-repentis]KAI1688992.1 hypothetical protein KJE20_02170 [Pyrenophora tritici-repentis]
MRLRNGLFTARAHEPNERMNGRYASDGEKVYPLFVFHLVCQQTRTETSLLQYKSNCFHFDEQEDLEFFSTQLSSRQRQAITDISISYFKHDQTTCGHYVHHLVGFYHQNSVRRLGFELEHPEADSRTPITLLDTVNGLRLRGRECIGLRLELFDVFDKNAVLDTKDSIVCTLASVGRVKWVHADTLVPEKEK